MLPNAEPTKANPANRPTISEVTKDVAGHSSFVVTFLPGQELPTHRNTSRIMISVLSGEGTLTVADDRRRFLTTGKAVQVDANAPHSLVAGPEGMVVEVHLVADCCASC